MSVHRPSAINLFDKAILSEAIVSSFKKLDPRDLVRNPVMFTTGVVALLSTIIFLRDIAAGVESTGDTTTLEDLAVLAKLQQKDQDEE